MLKVPVAPTVTNPPAVIVPPVVVSEPLTVRVVPERLALESVAVPATLRVVVNVKVIGELPTAPVALSVPTTLSKVVPVILLSVIRVAPALTVTEVPLRVALVSVIVPPELVVFPTAIVLLNTKAIGVTALAGAVAVSDPPLIASVVPLILLLVVSEPPLITRAAATLILLSVVSEPVAPIVMPDVDVVLKAKFVNVTAALIAVLVAVPVVFVTEIPLFMATIFTGLLIDQTAVVAA